jgi:hypothetical protein
MVKSVPSQGEGRDSSRVKRHIIDSLSCPLYEEPAALGSVLLNQLCALASPCKGFQA